MKEPPPQPDARFYAFGPYLLYVVERELFRSDTPVALPAKTFDTLLALVSRHGHLVDKDELLQRLWADTFVEEGSLVQQVSHLRKVLGKRPDGGPYVETVTKRGYRFVAPVEELQKEPRRTGGKRLALPSRLLVVLFPAVVGLTILLTMKVEDLTERLRAQPAAPRTGSVAVLPLQDMSQTAEHGQFADALTDALITELGKNGTLRVLSRQSVLRYKGAIMPLPEIAGELNADVIVHGTVQGYGSRIRVTVQVLDGRTDQHLWAESFEGGVSDQLRIQGEAARAVTHEVTAAFAPGANNRQQR